MTLLLLSDRLKISSYADGGHMIYLSEKADSRLLQYLHNGGYEVTLIREAPALGKGVGAHADLHMCRIGNGAVFAESGDFSPNYPQNAAFCAVCLDRYLIHRLDITAPSVLKRAEELGLTPVNVRQGYTRCSTVVVSGNAIITSDKGIYNAGLSLPDVDVLLINEGHVSLPGFPDGFLGGASGRAGGEIIFNGDLSRHPDFEAISDFIRSHGAEVRYFPEYELCDIGSIIEINKP